MAETAANAYAVTGANAAAGSPNAVAAISDTAGNLQQLVAVGDGTAGNASVVAGDSGQGSLVTAGARKEVTFTTTTAQAVASTDVSNYRWVSVHITSQGTSSTVTFQTSNDNSNWVSTTLLAVTNTGATAGVTSSTTANMWAGALHGRYFRLNVTGISAGTTAGVCEFYSQPPAANVMTALVNAIQSGTWTVGSNSAAGSAVPANAFYLGITNSSSNLNGVSAAAAIATDAVPGNASLSAGLVVFNGTNYDRLRSALNATNSTGTGILAAGVLGQFDDVSPTSITENQFGNLRMSANRNLYETIRDAAGNERGANVDASNRLLVVDQQVPAATVLNTYAARVTTNTTTTPTSSTAYISSIVVCVETAGTTSTLDIRDKQGTPIYLVRSLSTAAVLNNGDLVINFTTPVKMTSGIDIITGGSVAATVGVFVNYFQ